MKKIQSVVILVIAIFLLPIGPLVTPTLAADDNSKAVVLIKSFALDSSNFLKNYAQGSGTLISADGIILTNYHVVTQFASEGINDSVYQVCVTESPGQEPNCSYIASLIAKDRSLDVALLKISGIGGAVTAGLPFLTLNTADTLNVGDTVTAIGYPGIGGKTMTTTKGIVSGKVDKQYNVSWLKTDALISFGSSGGALIDNSGKLVGITTALSSSLSASLGYAVNTVSIIDWVNKNITGQPQSGSLQSRLVDFTLKAKNINSSNVFENSGRTFSITKPADWSFVYSAENKVLIYNANNADSGLVAVDVFRIGYKAPANAASGVLKRYFNENGASALITITSDKEVKVNGLKARLLGVSTLGKTYNYYAFSDGNFFIFVSYNYGAEQKDKDTVNGIINSISIKAGSQPFGELKNFSEKNSKLNLKANGNWVFLAKNNPVSPLDIYNKKIFDAYGRIKYVANDDQTNKMNNQQYLNYLKEKLAESNQITGIINYKVEVVKGQANANINSKIKNVIRLDSVEKSVSDNKIIAYDTDYYINLNDVYLNINLTVYSSDKKVYTKALAEFNSLLGSFTVDLDRKVTADVYALSDANKFVEALKKADEIKNIDTRVEVLAVLSSSENTAGHYPNTLKAAQKMVKLKPKDYYSLNYLGWAYLNLKDHKNAEKYLLQSIKAKSDYTVSRRNLANVYIDTKKYSLAEQQLLKVTTLDSKNPKAYYSLGLVYLNQEKSDKALTYYQKALDLNVANPVLEDNIITSAYYQLGYLYVQAGNCSKALTYLNDYLQYYLDDQDALNLLNQCQQPPVSSSCVGNTHLENGTCQSNTLSCQIANGTGQMTYSGSAWGQCQAISCNSGYQLTNSICQPVVSSLIQSANWTGVYQTGGWQSIALSSNGQYMIASADFIGESSVNTNGFNPGVYLSSDYGKNWSKKFSYGKNLTWSNSSSVDISDNGQYQVALFLDSANNKVSNVYVSSDFGENWHSVASVPASTAFYDNVAMSADGSVIAINQRPGQTLISHNYGGSWSITNISSENHLNIDLSSNGSYIAAISWNPNKLSISSDFGNTWVTASVPVMNSESNFADVAISSSGQYQIVANGVMPDKKEYIYVSIDYGRTWTAKLTDSPRMWSAVAISGDGKNQIALEHESKFIFVSSDYGNTWTTQDSGAARGLWHDVAFSRDGNYRGAVATWENIFVSP